ncbi:hypothetical protein [Methylobrevis pamukkalensis]|uniref:Uncharacterized protein n=1 Tax=Methylobrevis pamukkalensis TaxID=1439726 RepID=A0A1E3H6Q3_9HYPH|nr:hypothetical protein [Methylobrevis pamukkalensis]ODN72000.1 hypothetical protein A6302_00625 [Methylobrevis pamukkalensis]
MAIDVLDQAIARRDGSLIRAIEDLRSDGRSLVPFEPPEFNAVEETLLEENQLLDPERPSSRWRSLRRGLHAIVPAVRAK